MLARLSIFVVFSIFLIFISFRGHSFTWLTGGGQNVSEDGLVSIIQISDEWAKNPIQAPYKHKFWEVGQRSKQLGQWLSQAETLSPTSQYRQELLSVTETAAQPLFPFLQKPGRNHKSTTPLSDLRQSFQKGSRGIVIPVGGGDQSVRFAGHLVVSIRKVLGCKLPIQIAYAGDTDLPKESRDKILRLDGVTDVEFLDILTVFDDTTLKLVGGGWAIKAFALLGSKFEEAILLDADAVFIQKPEILFEQRAYIEKGAYLFHDRLLWQHGFRDRHDWWKDQIKEPSPEMNNSLVWTEDYAEECDSGVVVVNKARIDILVGLLHVAWQNTHDVREEVTYRLGHGDKESWWLGLELAGSSYEFEAHYGSILGWPDQSSKEKVTRVCSFVIAHTDENDKLIWYNGSLLKNKRVNPDLYETPEYWMKDGTWHKGGSKDDMSCMTDTEAIALTKTEIEVLKDSIELAKVVDASLKAKKD